MKEYTFERKIKTSDDWYPTFPDGTIEGSTAVQIEDRILVRISFWGEDDFGMDKWLFYEKTKENYKKACKQYKEFKKYLSGLKKISIEELKNDGFGYG